jgi:hypothetical protein
MDLGERERRETRRSEEGGGVGYYKAERWRDDEPPKKRGRRKRQPVTRGGNAILILIFSFCLFHLFFFHFYFKRNIFLSYEEIALREDSEMEFILVFPPMNVIWDASLFNIFIRVRSGKDGIFTQTCELQRPSE